MSTWMMILIAGRKAGGRDEAATSQSAGSYRPERLLHDEGVSPVLVVTLDGPDDPEAEPAVQVDRLGVGGTDLEETVPKPRLREARYQSLGQHAANPELAAARINGDGLNLACVVFHGSSHVAHDLVPELGHEELAGVLSVEPPELRLRVGVDGEGEGLDRGDAHEVRGGDGPHAHAPGRVRIGQAQGAREARRRARRRNPN